MENKIKIGYQGLEFSNSYYATQEYVLSNNFLNFELFPLLSSKEVVNNLLKGVINIGVMAVSNSIIGFINETQIAIIGNSLIQISKVELPIKHAAFKLNQAINNNDIIFVVSHPAVLEQCHSNILLTYPNAKPTPIANTALGPKYLVERKIDINSIVICTKQAGESNGLYMEFEDLSDRQDNITTFGIFELKNI